MSPMHGLIEVDVTEATRILRSSDPPLSFTAFVVATVGQAVARHPEVHAYRDWLGRIVMPTFVDVSTIVEIKTDHGVFPLAHLVRDADTRPVPDITAEIRHIKTHHAVSPSGRRLERLAPQAGRIPGLAWLFYQVMRRSPRMRQISGTVSVSAVGMFGEGSGYGIGFPTVMSLSVLVGGRSRRPVVIDDQVVVRDVIDLTVSFDHNVVDGGPATRFVADLRAALVTAETLS